MNDVVVGKFVGNVRNDINAVKLINNEIGNLKVIQNYDGLNTWEYLVKMDKDVVEFLNIFSFYGNNCEDQDYDGNHEYNILPYQLTLVIVNAFASSDKYVVSDGDVLMNNNYSD